MNGSTVKVVLTLISLYLLCIFGVYKWIKCVFRDVGKNTQDDQVTFRTAVLSTMTVAISAATMALIMTAAIL